MRANLPPKEECLDLLLLLGLASVLEQGHRGAVGGTGTTVGAASSSGSMAGFGAPCTAEDLYKTNKSDTDLFD